VRCGRQWTALLQSRPRSGLAERRLPRAPARKGARVIYMCFLMLALIALIVVLIVVLL
jgi:hypothetical protein